MAIKVSSKIINELKIIKKIKLTFNLKIVTNISNQKHDDAK